jgi:hypothetical protein
MVNIAQLKKNRNKMFNSLREEANKVNKKKQDFQKETDDPTFWIPKLDDAGNGYAIIRFLPPPENEDQAFIKLWKYGFKGPTGQWYIENSLTSIGEKDPVFELNGVLWNSGDEKKKDQVRRQKAQLYFYSNVLVVKDPANPENEGKVFRFRYGKQIFDMLHAKMHPEFEDEDPVNPFDPWEGANFKLKIRSREVQFPGQYKKVRVPNYEKSEFMEAGPIAESDSEIEEVLEQAHSLEELLAPENFKSYDQLKRRLDLVLTASTEDLDTDNQDDEIPWEDETSDDEEDIDAFLKKIEEEA